MKPLTKLAVGIMLIGLAPAIPAIESMLVNVAAFPNVAHNYLQAALVIAGFSFLYQATRPT